MSDLIKNKILWMVVIFAALNVMTLVVGPVIIDRTADAVIDKLEKDYSPSPYGPGFDPDKVSPEDLSRRALLEDYLDSEGKEKAIFFEENTSFEPSEWRKEWEDERGFKI